MGLGCRGLRVSGFPALEVPSNLAALGLAVQDVYLRFGIEGFRVYGLG